MARVPYVDAADLSDDYRYLVEKNSLGPLRIFRAFAHNPPLLKAYMTWGTALWEESGLSRADVEVVILTVASRLRSRYEWHQHVPIGRSVGLSRATVLAIQAGRYDDLDPAREALSTYADAYVDGDVDDALHDALADRFDPGTVVGVALLAGHYVLTARTLDALGVEPEEPFVGWDLSNAPAE